jgi:pyruvate,water dikinase
MMCELPSNAILADRFLEYFDGFSIGSNDMTQLTLGCRPRFRRRHRGNLRRARRCGQGDARARDQGLPEGEQVRRHLRPGSFGPPGSCAVAREQGIESMSLNPDTVVETWLALAKQKV